MEITQVQKQDFRKNFYVSLVFSLEGIQHQIPRIREVMIEDFATVHKNRKRCCDVWNFAVKQLNGRPFVWLEQANALALINHNGHHGIRMYPHYEMMGFEIWQLIAQQLLALLGVVDFSDESDFKQSGTIRFDFFETYGQVVKKFHKDEVDYVGIACLEKNGVGACTSLAADSMGMDIVFEKNLEPGDLLFFSDQNFWHYTSELYMPGNEKPRRLVLGVLVTFDKKEVLPCSKISRTISPVVMS